MRIPAARLLILFATLLLLSCGESEPIVIGANSDNGQTGPDPDCGCQYPDELEVSSCEGEDWCRPYTVCGETIYCSVQPACGECAPFSIQVDSCDGGDNCTEYFGGPHCGVLSCQLRPFDATQFDQSCNTPSDCVAVRDGNICECDRCPEAAINTGDEYEYERRLARCSSDCTAAVCERDLVTACVSNTCAVRDAVRVSAADFDQSCTEDADCVAVYEGEICAECQCPNAAVNVSEQERYLALFDESCQSDTPCPCAPPTVTCVDGTCRGPGGI